MPRMGSDVPDHGIRLSASRRVHISRKLVQLRMHGLETMEVLIMRHVIHEAK
jgi:hypothetical protein